MPDNIYDALENFRKADWTTKLLGDDVKGRYADLKQASADRCPRLRNFCQIAGSAISSRGVQPVPLEPVLDCERTVYGAGQEHLRRYTHTSAKSEWQIDPVLMNSR